MNRQPLYVIAVLGLLLMPSSRPRDGSPSPNASSQAPAPFDLAAARAEIEKRNVQFTSAHVSGDVATIDAMFTRDGRSLPPGAEAAVGPAALHALTVDFLKAGIETFTERTKYVNVWAQEDGTWKIQVNIWNTSPALAARK